MKSLYKWQDKTFIRKIWFNRSKLFPFFHNINDEQKRKYILSRYKQKKIIKNYLNKEKVWNKELLQQLINVNCEYKSALQLYFN